MKTASRKNQGREVDETLFGLLSAYRHLNTYIRLLKDEKHRTIALVLTSNPAYWRNIPETRFESYRVMKRVELNVNRFSLKYLSPAYVLDFTGPHFGLLKVPTKKLLIENRLADPAGGYYILEVPDRFLIQFELTLKKILALSPQKKYEIIEKSLERR